jgi:hypothetical protein
VLIEYLEEGRDEKLEKIINIVKEKKIWEYEEDWVHGVHIKQEILGQTNFLLSFWYNFNICFNGHTKRNVSMYA